MKRIIAIFLLGLLFTACQQDSEQENKTQPDSTPVEANSATQNKFLLSCEGVGELDINANIKQLQETFGKERVKTQEDLMNGGQFTAIYDDNAQLLFTIIWQEEKVEEKIAYVTVNPDNTQYSFSNGVQVGMTLTELLEKNGNAIPFYGFGWDYGGTIAVHELVGGIKNDCPCFGGVLSIRNYKNAPMGDGIFSSENLRVSTDSIVLTQLHVYHPDMLKMK